MLMAGYQTSNFSSFCTDLTSLYPTEVGISLFSHATMYMRNSSNSGLLLRVDCRIVKKQEEETFRTFFHIVLFSCFGQVQIRCIYGKEKNIVLVTVTTVMFIVVLQSVIYSLATAKFGFWFPFFMDSGAFSTF